MTTPNLAPTMLQLALLLIKEFEGLELTAYPDPLTGGAPWTIGYGCTSWADGTAVRRGETISKSEALQLLGHHLEHTFIPTLRNIPCWDRLTPGQQAALLSFAWNLGPGFYGAPGFETISRCLREERLADVPAALMLYCNPGSSVEAGLRRRRSAEGAMWRQGNAAQ